MSSPGPAGGGVLESHIDGLKDPCSPYIVGAQTYTKTIFSVKQPDQIEPQLSRCFQN